MLLDCAKETVLDLKKKLSFYKLRSKVEIGIIEELSVIAAICPSHPLKNHPEILVFSDPRNSDMGLRIVAKDQELSEFIEINNLVNADLDFYNYQRLNLKITDNNDLTYDQSLILEYGFEELNAISYDKGCYVGQEVTARTHYRGVIRKRIFLIKISNSKQIPKETEIICDQKKIGTILSSVFYNQELYALALIKNIDNNNQEIDLKNSLLSTAEGQKIIIIK